MFYSELKDWQTAIAALLGFGGLIWAVTLSARKQRERDDHIRNQEIQAMARALRSEITSITDFLRGKKVAIESIITKSNDKNNVNKKRVILTKDFIEWFAPTTPQIYERCMEKIGFLPDKVSRYVVKYFDLLTKVRNALSVQIKINPGGLDAETAQEIVDWYENLANIGENATVSLNQFLENNGGDAA